MGEPHPQGRRTPPRTAATSNMSISENTSNNDYERVMREYAEAGNKLIIGEVFGVEDAARAVAKRLSGRRLPDGLELQARRRACPNFAPFDNYIQDASYLTGIIAGAMTKSKKIGMVGGYPIPEVNRLMNAFMAGVKETRARRQIPGRLHRLLVRSAQGQGDRLRPDRWRRRPPLCRALRRLRRGQGARRSGHRQRHRHAGGLSRHRRRLGALALRADARQGHRRGEGRHLQGRRLRRLLLHEGRRLLAGAARHLRGQGARPRSRPRSPRRKRRSRTARFTVEINDTEPKSS